MMKSELTASTRLQSHPEVESRVLDGEVVLLNVRTGAYFGLNSVASHIWQLFSEGFTLDGVIAGVCSRFEVERERAELDVRTLTAKLIELDLLRA